jgi:hypothetical protein
MCDYSLHAVAQRGAKVGEKLVSSRFFGTTSRGFVSPAEPQVAVCLRPGTELVFERDVRVERTRWFCIPVARTVSGKVARFRKIDQHNPHSHHDALEFPSGETVRVTELSDGQIATVLQLPSDCSVDDSTQVLRVAQPATDLTVEGLRHRRGAGHVLISRHTMKKTSPCILTGIAGAAVIARCLGEES